jgi:hypothetical protein
MCFLSEINDRKHVNIGCEYVRLAHEDLYKLLSELQIFLYGHLSNCNFGRETKYNSAELLDRSFVSIAPIVFSIQT